MVSMRNVGPGPEGSGMKTASGMKAAGGKNPTEMLNS